MATKNVTDKEQKPVKPGQPDYVEHGSDRHAAILGLIRDESNPLGWRLADPTMFGAQVTQTYLDEVLRQKVAELNAGAPPMPQSTDPFAPGYAPTLLIPPGGV